MAQLSKHHRELTNGIGKCSVPMWSGGFPSGFCDELAYGKRPPSQEFYSYAQMRMVRWDNRYNGYVPGLACVSHGGPQANHFGDPCIRCGIPHDEVPTGPCAGRVTLTEESGASRSGSER
jgi:hypothetical protein